jgi:hypothetical protein
MGFQTSGHHNTTAVSVTAPLLTARVNKTLARGADKDKLPFSRATVEVTFEPYQIGVGVPAYLIPYEGGKSRGVKLPHRLLDNLVTVAAMTATQNGCTVEVSGGRQEPYASHTNVIDVKGIADPVALFQARRAKMASRLDKLQQRFIRAENEAGWNAGSAFDRRQFGYYPPPLIHDQPAVEQVNYAEISRKLIRSRAGVYTVVKTEHNPRPGVGLLEYVACPNDGTITARTDPSAMPNAILMGIRNGGAWTFYYQVYTDMQFILQTIEDGNVTTAKPVLQNNAPKKYACLVIVDHGEFWPNHTSNPLWA